MEKGDGAYNVKPGAGRGAFGPNCRGSDHLRRPGQPGKSQHGETTSNSHANIGATGDVSGIVLNSTLRADAVEFVPRSFQNSIPEGAAAVVEDEYGDYEQAFFNDQDEEFLLNEVSTLMSNLTMKPGLYDSGLRHFKKSLKWYMNSPDALKSVVENIFEHAVNESNFRYTAARLCQSLSKEKSSADTFRSLLLQRCQQEHGKRMDYALNYPERLRGFMTFLAELYQQLLITNKPLGILQVALVDGMKTLLSVPNKENLKCVCQMLKLTGATIDDNPNGNKNVLEDLMVQMREVVLVADVPAHIKDMVTKVIELRASNWGRPSTPQSVEENQTGSHGDVVYGPDGIVLSNEEQAFLEDQIRDSGEEDSDDLDIDDNLTPEERKAFYAFLRYSKQR